MTNFQIGIIAIFAILAIIGVFAFAGIGGFGGDKNSIGSVEIWGTIPNVVMNDLISEILREDKNFLGIKYVEKDKKTYESEFIEALASGVGPDLFLLNHNSIVRNQNKIIEIPYKNFPARDFKNIFIEEGELYLTQTGVLGFPFTIDPLVMYWNRDIFQTVGVSTQPKYWNELFVLSPKITQRDIASNITRSLVAFGEFRNIENAKEILSTLIMQSGNPIVALLNEQLESTLADKLGFATSPAEAAARFYTEFSNPAKSIYSWNRALPNSRQSFIAGDLAIYFGFASELPEIKRANPNLNFDTALMPQSKDSGVNITYGKMSAFAIPRASKNPNGAFVAALSLTSQNSAASLSDKLKLPPARRDLLSNKQDDPFMSIFYDSALMSKAWLEPDSEKIYDIFREMIESVTSGKARLGDAVKIADEEINLLLRRQ